MNELIGPELPAGEGAGGEARCVHPEYWDRPCGRHARVVRDGLPYCGYHDPLRRTAEGRAILAAEKRGRGGRTVLASAVCADVSDATLDRLARSGGLAAILDAIGELRAAYLVDEMAEGLPALLAASRRLMELAGYEAGREETDA